jgi:hypothetical protein
VAAESVIEDVDVELECPAAVGEDEDEALLHVVVRTKLGPPVTEVALALAVVMDLQLERRLAIATLPQDGMGELRPSIVSMNLRGRWMRPAPPASIGMRKDTYPSTGAYAGG